MYALVEINGKQYKAKKGSQIKVDLLNTEEGSSLEFDKVLLLRSDKGTEFGKPYVKNAKVKATLEQNGADPKVTTTKYKRRKGYSRKIGIRPKYSMLRVEDIQGAK